MHVFFPDESYLGFSLMMTASMETFYLHYWPFVRRIHLWLFYWLSYLYWIGPYVFVLLPLPSDISDVACQKTSWHKHTFRITWWRHQKEAFFTLMALGAGNHRSPVTPPPQKKKKKKKKKKKTHKGQWRGTLMFSLICALNKQLSK